MQFLGTGNPQPPEEDLHRVCFSRITATDTHHTLSGCRLRRTHEPKRVAVLCKLRPARLQGAGRVRDEKPRDASTGRHERVRCFELLLRALVTAQPLLFTNSRSTCPGAVAREVFSRIVRLLGSRAAPPRAEGCISRICSKSSLRWLRTAPRVPLRRVRGYFPPIIL